jgi:hypothetical protein
MRRAKAQKSRSGHREGKVKERSPAAPGPAWRLARTGSSQLLGFAALQEALSQTNLNIAESE